MENNLEELKKEFLDTFTYGKTPISDMYHWKYCRVEEVFGWIVENTVPKSEHEATKQALSKLQSQYLELEAENEKLREVVSQTANLLTNSILDSENLVAEARKEERAMIEQYISCNIFYTLGLYDIWNMLDGQQKETLTEAINIGISQAITADQQGDKI